MTRVTVLLRQGCVRPQSLPRGELAGWRPSPSSSSGTRRSSRCCWRRAKSPRRWWPITHPGSGKRSTALPACRSLGAGRCSVLFEAVYEERYQERYGLWRPIIGTVVRKFLECGDLKHGFARVRCPRCGEGLFVPFSCRGRCFCASCLPGRSFSEGRPPEAGAGEGGLGRRICLRRGAASAIRVHDSEAAADLSNTQHRLPRRLCYDGYR